MERLLLVGLGAALGGICRYSLGVWVAGQAGPGFPYGTLLINISGSFLLALLVEATTDWADLGLSLRLLLGVGFCGGYTTFSTFSLETLALLEARAYLTALLNVLGSLGLSLLGAGAGAWLGRLLP